MKKTPMPHQLLALRDIVPSAKKSNRLTVIMPCGTGKTMVQLWAAEALKPKTVLVLLPSLALLRQTLIAWREETKWQKPDILCVCSDQTVGQRSEDEIDISAEEIGHPVTSHSDEIAAFLSGKTAGVRLVFSTYHSSQLVADGMRKGFSFDLGVFDEAHVTAGQEGGFFSFALKDENLGIKVRTFWTATPRHYDLGKNAGEGATIVYSMDDESVFGKVVHKLAFREAVQKKIICDYDILVPVITNKMLGTAEIEGGEVVIRGQRVPARIVAHHMAINQAIKRYGIRKIFSFHPRVFDAREFTNGGPQSIARQLPKGFKTLHVNGAMTTVEREILVDAFRQAPYALMSNARCLTQGIDVPAVDMVAFLSKKRSLIDIVQATGRAMRRAPGKKKGYILVPLYLEQEEGETLETAVERADFREVWAVLNAMREQDEALADNVSRIRAERGEGTEGTRDIDNVTIMGPEVDLKRLRSSITTICVGRLERTRPIYGTWQEASAVARNLGMKSSKKYKKRYREDSGLPFSPNIYYRDFPGWSIFLHGKDKKELYRTWQEASKAAMRIGFTGQVQYFASHKRDSRLPKNPYNKYPDFPGWKIFLGNDVRRVGNGLYATWKEASKAAKKLRLTNRREYEAGYKTDRLLPRHPERHYKDFPGWRTSRGEKEKHFYASWQEASRATGKLGISSSHQYKKEFRKDVRLPSTPAQFYDDFPGWDTFLVRKSRKRALYPTWPEAAVAAQKLKFRSQAAYQAGHSGNPKLPGNPHHKYRDFPGWPTFLGKI